MAAAAGVAAGAVAATVFVPHVQMWAPVVRDVPARDAVALSFDDGPTEPFTSQILDLLAARGAQATFFVVGRNARRHPELLVRMREAGHTIGNHTYDHHHFGVMHFTGYWRRQVALANEAVAEACGLRPRLFRPPMGFKTFHQARALRALGMTVVGWRARAFDTRRATAAALLERLLPRVKPGAIVALHDGLEPARRGASQRLTVELLPGLLDALAARGLRCVNLECSLGCAAYAGV